MRVGEIRAELHRLQLEYEATLRHERTQNELLRAVTLREAEVKAYDEAVGAAIAAQLHGTAALDSVKTAEDALHTAQAALDAARSAARHVDATLAAIRKLQLPLAEKIRWLEARIPAAAFEEMRAFGVEFVGPRLQRAFEEIEDSLAQALALNELAEPFANVAEGREPLAPPGLVTSAEIPRPANLMGGGDHWFPRGVARDKVAEHLTRLRARFAQAGTLPGAQSQGDA